MGHLLQDASVNPDLRRSAEVYIHYGQIEVEKNYRFVEQCSIDTLAYYRAVEKKVEAEG